MRANSFIMLIIALVFGAVAVFFANIWLSNQTSQPIAVAVAPAVVETSTLVVAARDVSFGERLTPDMLREIPWPKSTIPDGSYAKIGDLMSDGGHVVLNPISPNEPVLKWKISGAGARASLSALVGPGLRAVSMRMNDVVGVAGFVLPGDRVDILYTKNGGDATSSTDILIQNVRVLAVDQVADQKKSDPILAKVITIEVAPVDGEKVALAQTTGSLSLTLRAAGGIEPAPAQKVVEAELVSSPSVYQTAFDAQAAAQAATDAKIKSLEEELKKSAASAGQGEVALRAKLAALEEEAKKTAAATGLGEDALRAKLAALEVAIQNAGKTSNGDADLRAKLAEFEANLRALASGSKQPSPVVEVVAVQRSSNVSVGITRGTKRDVYEVPAEHIN